ncbi:MAG TPA: acyl-CoA dehydrogenase family protein [Fimbriimonadaceae bacterium]|nr:acyl-CoA dehydrogenase family protein [Fimbriimonadaceae bacterium]
METIVSPAPAAALDTLPGDDVRQIMWRFADRYDLAMLVQAARGVARGPVARLVAAGGRNTHEWTPEKQGVLEDFEATGLTAAYLDPEHGGLIEGPKNLALALIAFELAWVDAGAATSSLAGHLGLAPIHERGTAEQQARYLTPERPDGKRWRAAFALTEPIPFVGVDTGVLAGKVRVAEWKDGEEPLLEVDKRGRFITNMAVANLVTAAVDSDDPRIKSSCMVILEETDPGVFDRGVPTRKLVHQLSSTRDPAFRMKVPASRIVGGYRIEDGVIVPNYNHAEIIEAVFRRTRVTVGLMTAAKLLSAVEPVIRYQRRRFRGGEAGQPGSPRHELGLQMKQDAVQRLVDVWATGEASASLGFAAARIFDELEPLEKLKDEIFEERKLEGARAKTKALAEANPGALELIALEGQSAGRRDEKRYEQLESDELTRFIIVDAVANVLCPACKLWNTGHGANMMREAVSLMGGYGITEDCPGFLGHKWMDAQLEATYEGPEAVQRRQLSVTMTHPLFLAQFREWIKELRALAASEPGSGACTLASAMEIWLWTLDHLQSARDANGGKLYQTNRQGITFPLADVLCWLLSARYFILDLMELKANGPANPAVAPGLDGLVQFLSDLSHVQSARAAGEVGRVCAELVYGYNRHETWTPENCAACYHAEELDALECLIPGFATGARSTKDIIEDDGSPPSKAGPCVRFLGFEQFVSLRTRLDGCLTGSGLAKDRAAESLTKVVIPEALDYPL